MQDNQQYLQQLPLIDGEKQAMKINDVNDITIRTMEEKGILEELVRF